MTRPRRISIGCYAMNIRGEQVVFQRDGRRGFKLRMGKGSLSQRFRRLRDAVAVAQDAVNPWPFTVEKKPDLAKDLPYFLRRKQPEPQDAA